MGIDAGIYNALGVRPKSMMDYQTEYNTLDQQRNALAQSNMQLQQAQAVMQQRNALRDAVQGGQLDLTNPLHQGQALALAPDVAPALLKTIQEGQTSAAVAKKDTAHADTAQYDLRVKKADKAIADISALTNPQQALASLDQKFAAGDIDQQKYDAVKATIPQDPAQFPAWRKQMLNNILDAKTQLELSKPVLGTTNLGGSTQYTSRDPLTGAITVNGAVQNTISPDTAATNATRVQTTGMTNATARANNQANIAKDFTIAGLNPNGTPITAPDGKVEPWIVNAAARFNLTGELPAGIGRGTQGPADMRRIQREAANQNAASGLTPEQRAQQQVTGKRTLASFAPGGKDGQAVEAADIGLNHLETLSQLAAAQANGNWQLFNKVANEWAKQTGNPAPTNLQGAITMVGPEITKAVVGVGGGVGDREKVDKALKAVSDGGPAQASGQLGTIEDLLGGRLMEKKRSYERGTGLHDFESGGFLSPAAQKVLSKRLDTAAAPAGGGGANADLHSQADAILRGSK
jgi:hypothetical protein